MRRIQLHFLLLLAALAAACNNHAQTKTELPPADYAKGITAAGIQLLDVRTAQEYRSGHIEASLQADWNDAAQFRERTAHLDKSRPVYVYCLSGGRSGAAAEYLRGQGFGVVVNLKGGVNAWRQAGMPLVADDPGKPQTPSADYERLSASAPTVIVDFGAEWCPPCKKMEPVLAAFMKDKSPSEIRLVKVDGGSETELMRKMGVSALPTFILYRNGKEVRRLQGVMTQEQLGEWVR